MALDGLKRRIMGSVALLKGKRKVDEETAKELAELIHVVYDITDAVDALLVTAEQVEQAKTMLKFNKSLKPL